MGTSTKQGLRGGTLADSNSDSIDSDPSPPSRSLSWVGKALEDARFPCQGEENCGYLEYGATELFNCESAGWVTIYDKKYCCELDWFSYPDAYINPCKPGYGKC